MERTRLNDRAAETCHFSPAMKFFARRDRDVSEAGFAKARSMGGVAEAVARVFRKAELRLRLIEAPDRLILIEDRLAVVEHAARELDDKSLSLRLSVQAGIAGLGPFGRRAPSLATAAPKS
jgi:hypothetical protein